MRGSIRLFVIAGVVFVLALGFWSGVRAAAGPAGGSVFPDNDFISRVFGGNVVGAQSPDPTETPQVGEDLQDVTPEAAQVGEDVQGQQNEAETPQLEADGEAHGTITALDASTVTVDGVVFNLSDSSEVNGSLQVGDAVKVEFITNPDGTLTIREIELSDGQNSSGDAHNSGDNSSGDDHGGSNSGSDGGGSSGSGGGGGGDDGGSGG